MDLFLPFYSILLYDHWGCGNSENEYVTLGLREAVDLDKIVSRLFKKFGTVNIFLWGWSMGAAAIIHYLHYLESDILNQKYKLSYKRASLLMKVNKNNNIVDKEFKKMMIDNKKMIRKCKKLSVLPLKEQNDKNYSKILSKYTMIKAIIIDSSFTTSSHIIKSIMVNH